MSENQNRANGGVSAAAPSVTDGGGAHDLAMTELVELIGYTPGEQVAVATLTNGQFSTNPSPVGQLGAFATANADADAWWSPNPTSNRSVGRKGRADETTRLAVLPCDLDAKPDGLGDLATCEKVVADLASILGTTPTATTFSGHGSQPLWALDSDDELVLDTPERLAAATALVRRWGRLVALVADRHGGQVDSVFNLDRLHRMPGTTNCKDPNAPVVAHATAPGGSPLSLRELNEAFDAYDVPEYPEDSELFGEAVSSPDSWVFGEKTSAYFKAAIKGWPTDEPPSGRHPWLVGQCVRLACAHRLGQITDQDNQSAVKVLTERFTGLCEDTKLQRKAGVSLGPEIRSCLAWHEDSPNLRVPRCAPAQLCWGVAKAASKTDAAAWDEIGGPPVPLAEQIFEPIFGADMSVGEFCDRFPHTVNCAHGDSQLRDYMGRLTMTAKLGKRTALLRDTAIPKVFSLIKSGCLGGAAVESLSAWVDEIRDAGGDDLGPIMALAVANTVPKTSCPTHEEKPAKGPLEVTPAATALADLASARYEFMISSDDEPFAVPREGPRIVRLLRGGKNGLRPELSKTYRKETGKVPPQQALADALLALEGDARDTDPVELHHRVAWHDGAIYLDLGDVTGRVIRVSPSGWYVQNDSPILFRRTALTGVLPEPRRGGDLSALWKWINVQEDDRVLLLGYLVAALIPDIPHPVLSLQGEQGTGKTTATRTCVALLDPSAAPLRKPPKDADGWVTAASGSWVVALDNVSAITPWLSDAICRAVTGDGDVRRKLYSDGDLAVFAFRRVVMLNGIDHGALRGDLSERLLAIHLDRIADEARLEDAELANVWTETHPRILGALLDLVSEVLAVRPDLHLAELPRMADFARILASVDRVEGTDSLGRYLEQSKDLNADSVTSEPAIAAMIEKVLEPGRYTSKELLKLIIPNDRPREWPNARQLTGLLKRHAPALRGLGWVVEMTAEKRYNAVVWHIEPPEQNSRDEGAPPREVGKLPTRPTQLPILPLSPPKSGDRVGRVGNSQPSRVEPSSLTVLCLTCGDELEEHLIAQGLDRHPAAWGCAA